MKILKWICLLIIALVALIAAFAFKAYWLTEKRLSKKYDFELQPLALNSDSAQIKEGARLVKIKSCGDCHSEDLGGKVWMDDALLGRIVAPNLTKGRGGLPPDYNANDWLRALSHGLKRDSTPLRIMPSHEYAQLTENDMAALVAYCLQLHPIDRQLPITRLGVLGYLVADLDMIPLTAAEKIDHKKALTKSVKQEISDEFGKYLSVSCEGCHRKNMKGGAPVAPGFPEVADITSTGHLGAWTESQFMSSLKTGITPEGKKLKPEEMPWTSFKDYTETELKALYKYLKSI
jgi:mono/diheme cytochrome c family protein